MDAVDLHILGLIQSECRRSAGELAHRVGLSVSAARDRLRRLEAVGTVRAHRALLDPHRLGLDLCAFVLVELEPRADDLVFAEEVRLLPTVQEAYRVTGAHSWLLKVRVRGAPALQQFIGDHLKRQFGAIRVTTMVAFDVVKETTELPLPGSDSWPSSYVRRRMPEAI